MFGLNYVFDSNHKRLCEFTSVIFWLNNILHFKTAQNFVLCYTAAISQYKINSQSDLVGL